MQIDEQNKIISDFFISKIDDFLEFLKINNIPIVISDDENEYINKFKKLFLNLQKSNYQWTKKQHYIQKAYLEKFINETGAIEVYDIKNNRNGKSVFPESICKENYFYSKINWQKDTFSQTIEVYLKHFEDKFIDIYDKLVNKIYNSQKINEYELNVLCQYISFSYFRSPYFRNQLQNMHNQIETQLNISNIFDTQDNSYHIDRLINWECEKFANLFKSKKIRIYISNWKRNFTTSDNCVVEIIPEDNNIPLWNTFYDRYHYFVLSPHILIEFINPEFPWKKIKIKRLDKNEVIFYNNLRYMHSKYLYSKDKNDFLIDDYSESISNDLDKYYNLFPLQFKKDKIILEKCKKIAKNEKIFYKNNSDLINKINSLNLYY